MNWQRRLIEEDFPLREVSDHSVRDKNTRQGHISALHVWWARKPLAASRATALAALLPDPGDDAMRSRLLGLVRDVAQWEVVSGEPESVWLLERAQKLILDANGGRPPKVLDCFAGGGSIPLEAQRIGCETYALDYNPVAVLLLKAVLEYPQNFRNIMQSHYWICPNSGQQMNLFPQSGISNPLLSAIDYWSRWVFEEARNELEAFYPPDESRRQPSGYIWVRTLPCQNQECGAEIPLLPQTWLSKKDAKIALRMIPDRMRRLVNFEIAKGEEIDFNPKEGTVSRAHVRCPLCGSTIDGNTTRLLFRQGMAAQRMVVVLGDDSQSAGKIIHLATARDIRAYDAAEVALLDKCERFLRDWGIAPIPDEPVPLRASVGIAPPLYGMSRWGDLFNARQKLAIVTFADAIRRAYVQMIRDNADSEFARAVTTYLAIIVSRLCDRNSNLVVYDTRAADIKHLFVRPALSIAWLYAEINPLSETGWPAMSESVKNVIENLTAIPQSAGVVLRGSATSLPWPDNFFDAVLIDPPYYDNFPYADLSDFFYVWLRRTIGELHPTLFDAPLTPKDDEIVANHGRYGGKDIAGRRFEALMTLAFREISRVLNPDGVAVIVFAHKSAVAWERLIGAMLKSGLHMTASWPIHTELQTRMNAQRTAAMSSSIYMVCRKRTDRLIGEFSNILPEIEVHVRERLKRFWNDGIRGTDVFMSAIGPAVEVFSRYERVERQNGEQVEVRELLDCVRNIVREFFTERALMGLDLETNFYLMWRRKFRCSCVSFEEASKLAEEVGVNLNSMFGPGNFVRHEDDCVRVLGPMDRLKDEFFINGPPTGTMVDALHRACIYWKRGERKKLEEWLVRTHGANNMFWLLAQAIAECLPDGKSEKILLHGLLSLSYQICGPESECNRGASIRNDQICADLFNVEINAS